MDANDRTQAQSRPTEGSGTDEQSAADLSAAVTGYADSDIIPCSEMSDRITQSLARRIKEGSIGFKQFGPGYTEWREIPLNESSFARRILATANARGINASSMP